MKKALITTIWTALIFINSHGQTLYINTVFDDIYQGEWHPNHWGDISETLESIHVFSGSYSLSITHNNPEGWDGFSIVNGQWSNLHTMYPGTYKTLSFFFNPGENLNELSRLYIGLQDGYFVPLEDYLPESISENRWVEVRIPVSHMCGDSGGFFRIVFFNNSSETGLQYFLDTISLEWEEDTTPPKISQLTIDNSKSYQCIINWETDESTRTLFEYGISDPGENQIEIPDFSTSHQFKLTSLAPLTQYTFRITAYDFRESEEDALSTTYSGSFATPAETPPETVYFTVDPHSNTHHISPYIYGTNFGYNGRALQRAGGNRWTAYNWETNASNAGSDYYHQNDGYLTMNWDSRYSESGITENSPGAAVWRRIVEARSNGAASLITVPIIGRVAADKEGGGDVGQSNDFLNTRFVPSYPTKHSELSLNPDLDDNAVYQDEFVYWVEHTFFPEGVFYKKALPPVFYCMDNEPGLWASTHCRAHPDMDHYAEFLTGNRHYSQISGQPVTYTELMEKSIASANSIKRVAPDSTVFGFVSYGFNGYVNLQNASDSEGRDFIEFFLSGMHNAEVDSGIRLLDILDLHWYPEATDGTTRITTSAATDSIVQARLQAPRSLWDETYEENSWISRYLGEPIQLIPRMKEKIDSFYPGTELAFTEYHFGGGGHISGGIAQADVLGIFGRENIFAACLWTENPDNSFIYGGFDMFRNYDGKNGSFGDISISAVSEDIEKTSIYASLDSQNPERMVIILLNKTENPLTADIVIQNYPGSLEADVFQLTEQSPVPLSTEPVHVSEGEIHYAMPPYSVSVLELIRDLKHRYIKPD